MLLCGAQGRTWSHAGKPYAAKGGCILAVRIPYCGRRGSTADVGGSYNWRWRIVHLRKEVVLLLDLLRDFCRGSIFPSWVYWTTRLYLFYIFIIKFHIWLMHRFSHLGFYPRVSIPKILCLYCCDYCSCFSVFIFRCITSKETHVWLSVKIKIYCLVQVWVLRTVIEKLPE